MERSPVAGGVGHWLRRSTAGTGRRWLLVAVLVVGAAAAVLVAVAAPVPTVAVPASAAQLLMSVLVPLSGVLLAQEWARGPGGGGAGPVVLAAASYAAAVALLGFAACVVAVALVPSAALGGPATVVAVALGGIGVQVTAQLVGTGLGFLLRRPLVAFLGTVVLPLGVWLTLGALGPLAWLRAWLTPFGATPPLLTGSPSTPEVVAWLVVLALWGGALNAAGVWSARRRPVT
ncbi:hypothetical protein [Pseudonocardia broussonetiae]|uniref:Uncharacterized protein n=1 Tax=Pseudonocardia broussonetiae TaxID=2736640 RepID=A0A6M6JCN3_9PSEU|nr:hypothetical protein [Pseudonocardia broussonetiae]QJY45704.1 hypothetical protein HOP40_07725 [Pseudonocardia broussonetiae]